LEMDHRRAEPVLLWRRLVEGDRLDARVAADADVRELGREVDPQILRRAKVRRVLDDIPHPLGLTGMTRHGCVARIDRQANGFVAEVYVDRALERELAARQEAAQLPQAGGRAAVRGVARRAVTVVPGLC
jgi:hypothetical protein